MEQEKYPESVLSQLREPCSEILSLELVEELIWYICKTQDPGAILVFLPGMSDLVKLNSMLLKSEFYSEGKCI